MVRLIDRPNMTIDVCCGGKTATQQQHKNLGPVVQSVGGPTK